MTISYPDLLQKRYQVEDRLSGDSDLVLFRCRDLENGQSYAIFFLNQEIQEAADLRQFKYTCEAVQGLSHPNLVTLHAYGVERCTPYLITELCTTEDGCFERLQSRLDATPGRALPSDTLLGLAAPLLHAAAYLHSVGLTHRGIRPTNIVLHTDRRGRLIPKMSCLPLVRFPLREGWTMWDPRGPSRVPPGTSVVNLERDYRSPEDLAGDTVDARADVYSLGATLYRLATGSTHLRPFYARELASEANPAVPSWLDQLIEKAISTDPEKRWRDAGIMFEAIPATLRKVQQKWHGAQVRKARLRRSLALGGRVARSAAARRRRSPLLRAVVAIFLLLIVVLTYFLTVGKPLLVDGLARVGPSATPMLRRCLKSRDVQVRRKAAAALASFESVEDLVTLLCSGDTETADIARRGLAKIGPRVAGRLVVAVVREDPGGHIPASALLLEFGADAVPAIVDGLGRATGDARIRLERVLLQLKAPAVPAMLAAMPEAAEDVRERLRAVLAGMGSAVLNTLIELLGHEDDLTRDTAAEELTALGKAAVPVLVPALMHDSLQVRELAAACLTAIGEDALDALIGAVGNPELRKPASDVLAGLGTPAETALLAALHNADTEALVRANVAQLLGRISGVRAALPLTHALADDAAVVAAAALRTLKQFGQHAAPALVTGLETPSLRPVAVRALRELGPDAVAALIPVLGDRERPAEIRCTVADVLGHGTPGQDAASALVFALIEPDETVQQCAESVLLRVGPGGVPALVRALGNDRLRTQAVSVLERIDPPPVQELRAALADHALEADTRCRVAQLIAGADAAAAADRLIAALDDPFAPVRRCVALQLVALQDKAVPRLIEALTEKGLQTEAAAILVQIGAPAVPALEVLARDTGLPGAQRCVGTRLLGRIAEGAAATAVVALLVDPSKEVKTCAGEAIVGMGARAVPVLVGALAQPDLAPLAGPLLVRLGDVATGDMIRTLNDAATAEPIRCAVARLLGQAGSKREIEALVDVLKTEHAALHSAAEDALRAIGAPAVALLVDRATVRKAAAGEDDPLLMRLDNILMMMADQARPVLIGIVRDQDAATGKRRCAVEVLGRLADAVSLRALVSVLADAEPAVSALAAATLAEAGPAAIPLLAQGLADSALRASVKEILLASDPVPVVQAVSRLLGDERGKSDARCAAAALLAELPRDVPHGVAALLRGLGTADADTSQCVADSLSAVGKTAVPGLIRALRIDTPELSTRAAQVLGRIADPVAVPDLIACLERRDEAVRRAAVAALGQYRGEAAVAALKAAVRRDRDWSVRVAAARQLGRPGAGAAVRSVLTDTMRGDASAEVRQAAVAALGATGDPEAGPALMRLLRHAMDQGNYDLAVSGIEALGAIGHPQGIDLLVQVLKGDRLLRSTAKSALADIGLAGAEAMLRYLRDSDATLRESASDVIGRVARKHPGAAEVGRAIDPLIRLLLDSNPLVRASAREALIGIGRPALPALDTERLRLRREIDERKRYDPPQPVLHLETAVGAVVVARTEILRQARQ